MPRKGRLRFYQPGLRLAADFRKQIFGRLASDKCGEPQATAGAILKTLDAENPPLHFAVGSEALLMRRGRYLTASPFGKRGKRRQTPR